MPALEIRLPTGSTNIVQLSKDMPISIGSHPSNDVPIDDASIAALHCRVSWQQYSYRVNSAAGSQVLLNGKEVAKASLKVGDLISIGKVKIKLVDENRPGHDTQAKADISEFELMPLDDEETIRAEREALYAPQPDPEPPPVIEKAPASGESSPLGYPPQKEATPRTRAAPLVRVGGGIEPGGYSR